ncbi:MAG: tetratricopeptide repeat protein [Planctomycetota bacterium]
MRSGSKKFFTRVCLSVIIVALGTGPIVAQVCIKPCAELLALKRATKLYAFRSGSLVVTRNLTAPAFFVGTECQQFGPADAPSSYRFVRPVRPGNNLSGWVSSSDLDRPSLQISEMAKFLTDANRQDLPEVIRLQKNETIKKAWDEVKEALKENETLKPQLPEPYFARAEIWSAVNNYDGAMRDYLTATQLARKSGQDLASYSAYFDKLYEALDNWDRVPRPPTTGARDDYQFLAEAHFARGFSDFWDNDLQSALRRFDNAVQLDPQNPVYWYYRALAFKRSGDDRRAQHDVCFGAYVEKKGDRHYNDQLSHVLQRLQGGQRQWIENFRMGDCSHRIVEGVPLISN